jgi:hypothetical protein
MTAGSGRAQPIFPKNGSPTSYAGQASSVGDSLSALSGGPNG